MFEFFKRVKTVVSAELHDMIDKAEDPAKMVDQYLREMSSEIQDAEKATAKIVAEEKLLKKKLETVHASISKREEQAVDALKAGNEELAKRALHDKLNMQEEASQLESLYNQTVTLSTEMKGKLKEMKAEYREMEHRKNVLKSRATSAKARTQINKSLSSINNEGSKKGFERMEEKIMFYEAEAETSEDLQSSRVSLDDELKQLKQKSGVDAELEKLKEQLKEDK
jgi:phage shock protein A